MKKRLEAFRARYLRTPPSVCPERAVLFTASIRKNQDQPPIIARAMALCHVLTHMTIYMDPESLLVGNQARAPRAAPVCPEYSTAWIEQELDSFSQRPSDPFTVSPETKMALQPVLAYWKGRTLQDRALSTQPQPVLRDLGVGVLGWEGNITAGDGHIVVDYERLLADGVPAICAEVTERLAALNLSEPDDIRKLYFYRAAEIALAGTLRYIGRFEALTRELAARETDAERKSELAAIADRCHALQTRAPESFLEALQLIWFIHVILHIETNGHSLSLGRLDQYLYPYFAKDFGAGALDEETAMFALGCLYIKMFGNIKLRSWASSKTQLGYPTYQNICFGGQDARGEDATNALSHLCLETLKGTRLSEPNIYIRLHPGTPKAFWTLAVEVLKLGFGMPAMVSDAVIVPSLIERGVSLEDARCYSTFGCAEVLVPGKWGYRANGKCKVNVLKVLEIALNGGIDPRTGARVVEGLRPLTEAERFEDVMGTYRAALEHYMRLQITADNLNDYMMEEMVPDALCSALVQDCLPRGKTIKQGGAVYDIISGCLVGVPNVGNALFAIKDLVFDRKLLTKEALMDGLRADFANREGERLQRLLLTGAKKYGNDEDCVDAIVKETADYYFEKIPLYKNMRHGLGPIGGNFTSSTVTISGNVPSGRVVGATPDGRKSGTPTCDGVSPMHNTQTQGPTAVFNSVAKLSTRLVTGGQLLNMRFQPALLNTQEQTDKFIALIQGFFQQEGWHVQFNMVSTDVLRAAQKDPENYRDLVVRVAGYSALFTALDKETQEDIIHRQEHKL